MLAVNLRAGTDGQLEHHAASAVGQVGAGPDLTPLSSGRAPVDTPPGPAAAVITRNLPVAFLNSSRLLSERLGPPPSVRVRSRSDLAQPRACGVRSPKARGLMFQPPLSGPLGDSKPEAWKGRAAEDAAQSQPSCWQWASQAPRQRAGAARMKRPGRGGRALELKASKNCAKVRGRRK